MNKMMKLVITICVVMIAALIYNYIQIDNCEKNLVNLSKRKSQSDTVRVLEAGAYPENENKNRTN